MLGLSTQNAVLIVSFKLNQKYISSKACQNRYTTAEKVCNGKCYLEDQLVEQNDVKDNELPALNEVKETVLFYQVLSTLIVNREERKESIICRVDGTGLTGHLSGVFRPPQG